MRALLQEVWSGPRRLVGSFLHSPLLEELRSLEAMLQRQARKRGGSSSPTQPATQVALCCTCQSHPSCCPSKHTL